MRLSIREEVAYNRIVTELIDTAMAEAIAKVELERMLDEMEEYLVLDIDVNVTRPEKVSQTMKQEKETLVTGPTKKENDEINEMLDNLERKLLSDSKTQLVDEHQCINKETPQEEAVHLDGKDVDKKIEDDNGKVAKLTEAKEPTRSEKHRHLSIFTKRGKTKPKVDNEDISSTSSEKKSKKEKSVFKRFMNLFCCCCKREN